MDNNVKFDINSFLTRLKAEYRKKDMTQDSLSQISGVNEHTISYWFRKYDTSDTSGNIKRKSPSLSDVYRISQVLDVSIDYLANPEINGKTITKQQIHKYTGLSDNALNTLKMISSKEADDIRYKYIMQALNLILDSEYNAGVLFWIGLFIFGQLDGYLYETKEGLKKQPFIDMGQLGKGIHFYGNNGDELTLEADLLNTAIFDRIRNSLENLEELQN